MLNFLKKAWNNILSALDLDEDTVHVPDSHNYPPAAVYAASPHVVHHAHNAAYVNEEPFITGSFEEDYVDTTPRKKRGPKSKYATEEERLAARKAYEQEYHRRKWADPDFRNKKVEEMRKRRGKTAETVQGYSARNLGISHKDNPKEYNKAYYEQVKKTGNTAATFSK